MHLHIQSARWQARINFHKKETASHPQTIVQASALIFKLGGDSSHLGQEPGRWHLAEVTLAALPARSPFYSGFIGFSVSFRLGIRLLWVSCTPVGMQHPQVLTPDLEMSSIND